MLSQGSFSITWAPGKNILYHKPEHRNYHLLDPETEQEKPLLPDESQSWSFSAVYSPDGENVVLNRNMQYERDQSGIWRVSLNDSSLRFLQPGDIYPLVWSSDKYWIYALSHDEGRNDIVRFPADSGQVEYILTLPAEKLEGVSVTPDGRHIVYAAVQSQSDIWVMEHFDPENEIDESIEFSGTPKYRQLALLDSGRQLYRQKKYAQAAQVYEQGLELENNNVLLLSSLGWSYIRQGESEKAENVFKKASKLNAAYPEVMRGLASTSFDTKHYDRATHLINMCLEQPGMPLRVKKFYCRRLGVIAIIQQRYDDAEAYFKQAWMIDSTSVELAQEMCNLYAELEQFEKAVPIVHKLLKQDSSFNTLNIASWILVNSENDVDLGISLAKRARDVQPEKWLESLNRFPYYPVPEYTLGVAWTKKADYNQARHYLEMAIEIDPNRQEIQDALAEIEKNRTRI